MKTIKEVSISFAKGKPNEYTYTFTPTSLQITNLDFFTVAQLNALEAGKTIKGKIELSQISHAMIFESEGVDSCKIYGLLDTYIVD